MTREQLIDFCLTFPAAYKDNPFTSDAHSDDGDWCMMRHGANKKGFAHIFTYNGKLCINLKCDPLEAGFLRQAFQGVIPGYHMNKTHWNTIIMGSDVPDDEIERQIGNSYNLIKPKT